MLRDTHGRSEPRPCATRLKEALGVLRPLPRPQPIRRAIVSATLSTVAIPMNADVSGKDLVVSSTIRIDMVAIADAFGPIFKLEEINPPPRKITGLEVAVSFFVSIAANAAYYGAQTIVESLIRAVCHCREEARERQGIITVVVDGTRVEIRADTDLPRLEVIVTDWARKQCDGR